MAQTPDIKETMLSQLRFIELQARLLLLASTFDGFRLQSEDVACLGIFLTDYADRVKKSLEVRHGKDSL